MPGTVQSISPCSRLRCEHRIFIAMSLGYADRLSWREDLGGTLGAPELQDSDADVARKVAVLARYVRGLSVAQSPQACKAHSLTCSGLGHGVGKTHILEGTQTSPVCAGDHLRLSSRSNGATCLVHQCAGPRGGADGRLHGCGHQHGVRHPRLSRPRRRVDLPACAAATAASEHQLCVRKTQPDAPGVHSNLTCGNELRAVCHHAGAAAFVAV